MTILWTQQQAGWLHCLTCSRARDYICRWCFLYAVAAAANENGAIVRFVMFLVCVCLGGVCVGRQFLHLILGGSQETIRKLYDKSGRGIYFRSFASKNASSALCLGESL